MAFTSNFSISAILCDQTHSHSMHETETAQIDSDHEIDVVGLDDEETGAERPQLTYDSLIMMAIKNSYQQRLTLSEIYQYITDNFPYYRSCKTQWRNSIRHNLSINKCFVRIPRELDNPGRGSYWGLSMEAQDMYIGDDTGRLRQVTYQSQNYYDSPSPPMQGVPCDCGYCGTMACATYQAMIQITTAPHHYSQIPLMQPMHPKDFSLRPMDNFGL